MYSVHITRQHAFGLFHVTIHTNNISTFPIEFINLPVFCLLVHLQSTILYIDMGHQLTWITIRIFSFLYLSQITNTDRKLLMREMAFLWLDWWRRMVHMKWGQYANSDADARLHGHSFLCHSCAFGNLSASMQSIQNCIKFSFSNACFSSDGACMSMIYSCRET